MTGRSRGQPGGGSYFGPYAGSVLLHLALFALFGVGWFTWKRSAPPPQPRQLAIEAVVVDPKSVPSLRTPQREVAPAPPLAPPPAPARDDVQERQRAEARQRAEDQRKAEAERKAAEDQRRADEQREAAAKRAADEQRKADERKADEKRKAEARQRAEREAELRRGLEAEERVRAARASGAGAQWRDLITAKIMSEWRRPPTARAGIVCTVQVTQVPGGEVVAARILSCNGDAAVRQSIEAAVMNASPLPPPPDPALFERNLEVVFKPHD